MAYMARVEIEEKPYITGNPKLIAGGDPIVLSAAIEECAAWIENVLDEAEVPACDIARTVSSIRNTAQDPKRAAQLIKNIHELRDDCLKKSSVRNKSVNPSI